MTTHDINHYSKYYQWGIVAWNPAGWWYLINPVFQEMPKDEISRNRVNQATLFFTRKEAREVLRMHNKRILSYHRHRASLGLADAEHSRNWIKNRRKQKLPQVRKVYVRASLYEIPPIAGDG